MRHRKPFAPGSARRLPYTAHEPGTLLNVAIYPYVPRPAQFEAVLRQAWRQQCPEVELHFVDYDCYHQDPPAGLDVFVFDTLFLESFALAGFLMPLDEGLLEPAADFMPYALAGCRLGPRLYALPYLGCADVIFHRASDAALASVRTLDQLFDQLGEHPRPTQVQPAEGEGLLIDLTGRTTDACLYLQGWSSLHPGRRPAPLPCHDALDHRTLEKLQLLTRMAGAAHASFDDGGSQRLRWFVQGGGRALVNVTETLCSMPASLVDRLDFQAMPQAAATPLPPLYVDGVAVRPGADGRQRDLALRLAHLMCSSEVMLRSMLPHRPGAQPQYLLPVRRSVLRDLMPLSAPYARMAERFPLDAPQCFRIDGGAREWVDSSASAIRLALLNVCPEFPVHDGMFDDSEPMPADKSRPANLFRRK
ncbi:thiamine pyridinylase [Aquabacterium sp. A7-Y]|uniref:thiamine pyridinylase n=1 Tax=Aquabacterium sp. A7-Y TaxID=1349605 RepID=UPI00223D0D97|nr:thiamine pyridinylase [Aquabacterium sp. A7-Y]MCW7539579.1 thiamine pyridinylase [Aquabacterium sp. A7-Y]